MTWTREQQLDALMRLPWSIVTTPSDDGTYLVATVAGMPDAMATGADDRALAKDLYGSLRASLACRLEFGDEIPLPAGCSLPWANGAPPRVVVRPLVARAKHSEAWSPPVLKSTGAFQTVRPEFVTA